MNNIHTWPFIIAAACFRWFIMLNKYFFWLACSKFMQPIIAWMGPVQAYMVYNKASRDCPAYKKFLSENMPTKMEFGGPFSSIPETNKENYIKKYSVEERCYFGKIPKAGVVIDESSGSSGAPNNWVRGPKDRSEVKRLLQFCLALTYPGRNIFFVNCFALGPWATGMNVSMSVADVAILKSIGPDEAKLENTLKTFGTDYEYVIVGYPPFIKLFVNSTKLNLKDYKMHLITGGEAISDGLRHYLSQYFITVISSYGASDLDINIAFETDYTIALREACLADPALTKEIFGRDQVPMIFQYNPQDYYIESSPNGDLIFTICRLKSSVPKVRYNIRDSGGVMSSARITKKFQEYGIKPIHPRIHFPVLYIFGRADLSVPFYGAKVFTTDIDTILHESKDLSDNFNSFQMSGYEDKELKRYLKISLELQPARTDHSIKGPLNVLLFEQLKKVNQDFREVSKMFSADNIVVEVHQFTIGPFKDRDIRIKQKYVANNV